MGCRTQTKFDTARDLTNRSAWPHNGATMNPKRVKINFRLNAETKRKAEKLADSLGISLNDVLSLAVTEYLKAELKREPKP